MQTTYKGPADTVTKVKLPSAIDGVYWSLPVASPGSSVSLEVRGLYIGEGADLEIELSDAGGRKHGAYKDKMYGSSFRAKIVVPAAARDALIAEVKLPRHGLSRRSPAMLLSPAIQLLNLKWSATHARRGDIVSMTADVKNAFDGTEAEISVWEHDDDGAHDLVTRIIKTVENEAVEAAWEFEYQEDTDDIPRADETEKGYAAPEYFFRVDVRGVTADSGLLGFKDWVEVELVDGEGRPVAGERYVLTLPDGTEREGKLDEAGLATVKDVQPGKTSILFPDLESRDWTE